MTGPECGSGQPGAWRGPAPRSRRPAPGLPENRSYLFWRTILPAQTRVTLIEGHVVVIQRKPSAPLQVVSMQAGQQYVARSNAAPQLAMVNLESATAWESGRIVVDNQPLVEVVGQINRYTSEPVTIADPEIAQLRVSGVFVAGDVATFVDSITHYLPVDAVTDVSGGVRLRKRG